MAAQAASLCLAGCLAAAQACAHQMPSSDVLVDFRSQGVEVELRLPVDRLQVALRHDGTGEDAPDASAMLGSDRARVASYVLDHVQASSISDAPWTVQLVHLGEMTLNGVDDLVVHLVLRPPSGSPVDVIKLQYDVIIRELVTHSALVSVRTDWRSGIASDSPVLVGAVGVHHPSLVVDRSGGSAWRGLRRIFLLGMDHIAEGTDHLLFLLTLLLPAPLLAANGRWIGAGAPGRSALRVGRIVTAFTVGHSLTLMLGALGMVRVPEPPIEVLIAASILISAVHALRPIFPGREFLVAGGFGLVHGLAFATVISELGLDRWGMVLGILGFNVGIETMQLVVVLAALPWLLLLSTTRAYPAFRVSGAAFAALAATGWIADRTVGLSNPVDPVVTALAAHPLWIVALLAFASAFAKAAERVRVRGSMRSVAAHPFLMRGRA